MTTEQRSKLMGRVRSKNTIPELTVRKLLHGLGYRFRIHRKDLPGSPDIVLPRYRAVMFINGCFWHGHSCFKGKMPESNTHFWNEKIKGNKKRDENRKVALENLGWKVVIIWECEIPKRNELIERLRTVLQ